MSDDINPFCKCGHPKSRHSTTVIPKGQYGEGGFCAYMLDRMYGGTDECFCEGFALPDTEAGNTTTER
jgi:hypothetical protein